MQESPSVTERVQALLKERKAEDAQKLVRELADMPAKSLEAAKEISKCAVRLGLSGAAELAIARYVRANPDDRQAKLTYLEMRLPSAPKYQNLSTCLDGFVPETPGEYLKLVKALTNFTTTLQAIELCEQGLAQFPDHPALLQSLIKNLVYRRDYSSARRLIAKVIKLLPDDDVASWSFIALQSSVVADDKIFALAAAKAEVLLDESDPSHHVLLLRAYDQYKDKANIERLLAGVRLERVRLVHSLGNMLQFAERYWLTELQVKFARRILSLNSVQFELRQQCEMILKKYAAADGSALARKSLFL